MTELLFEKMMSVSEVARIYGLTRFAVYAAIYDNRIKSYKLGRITAIYSEDAEKMWGAGKVRQGRPRTAFPEVE